MPKASVLQANAKLAQKGGCWTWNQRSWVQSSLGIIFCYWNFLFLHSKDSDANIGITANFVYFVKNSIDHRNALQLITVHLGQIDLQYNWHLMRHDSVVFENMLLWRQKCTATFTPGCFDSQWKSFTTMCHWVISWGFQNAWSVEQGSYSNWCWDQGTRQMLITPLTGSVI